MANETCVAELQAPALGRLSATHKAETAEHLMKQTTISIYLNTPDKSSEVLAHPNHSTSSGQLRQGSDVGISRVAMSEAAAWVHRCHRLLLNSHSLLLVSKLFSPFWLN